MQAFNAIIIQQIQLKLIETILCDRIIQYYLIWRSASNINNGIHEWASAIIFLTIKFALTDDFTLFKWRKIQPIQAVELCRRWERSLLFRCGSPLHSTRSESCSRSKLTTKKLPDYLFIVLKVRRILDK
ncbi:hypothetical protein Tsp_11761 [Trichinella spiralis]|uniref:hypothetical protein n=1 Tax=Trichinella spiralis TaxID=6334 RepID=UPI0001EFEA7D|nr:hypothetical protein Tsp_11761 [Trichinella spiralis]